MAQSKDIIPSCPRQLSAALDALRPSKHRTNELNRVASMVSATIWMDFGMTTVLVGSAACGLATCSSDLDFALLPTSRLTTKASSPRSPLSQSKEEDLLTRVSTVLIRKCGMKSISKGVISRARAPSVVKCIHRKSGIHCDIVVSHGTLGVQASICKTALLRHLGDVCSVFADLCLLVKGWADARGQIDPSKGKLNSFTIKLMVALVLQSSHDLEVPDIQSIIKAAIVSNTTTTTPSDPPPIAAIQSQSNNPPTTQANDDRRDDTSETSVVLLEFKLATFFKFWRDFDYGTHVASVRLGRTCRLEESGLGTRANGVAMVVEDPIETDENTARTLTLKHLQELRAELNRASHMLETQQPWKQVCVVAQHRNRKELQPYLLPEGAVVANPHVDTVDGGVDGVDGVGGVGDVSGVGGVESSNTPSQSQTPTQTPVSRVVAGTKLNSSVRHDVLKFIKNAECGDQMKLEHLFNGDQRRSLHHCANVCGIESNRVGKAKKGMAFGVCAVVLKKPKNWVLPSSLTLVETSQSVFVAPPTSSSLETTTQTVEQQQAVKQQENIVNHCGVPPEQSSPTIRITEMLRSGKTLDALVKKYKLIHRHHPTLPLVQLSYSQTQSSMASPLVQECRGVILETQSWNIVGFPFKKFFNLGEPHAKPIDWDAAKVFEKLDGSIMMLYFYAGAWHVASSKMPAANGLLSGGGKFVDMFWQIWKAKGFRLPQSQTTCYMFEMTTSEQTIIVRHSQSNLAVIGARDMRTLTELDCEEVARVNGWLSPRRFNHLRTMEDVLEASAKLNPIEHEGFVVVDKQWRRLKIKSPAYVALHHLGGNHDRSTIATTPANDRFQRQRLIEIARCNEGDEFLAYYPQLADEYKQMVLLLRKLHQFLQAPLTPITPNLLLGGGRSSDHPQLLVSLHAVMRSKNTSSEQFVKTLALRKLEEAVGLFNVGGTVDGRDGSDATTASDEETNDEVVVKDGYEDVDDHGVGARSNHDTTSAYVGSDGDGIDGDIDDDDDGDDDDDDDDDGGGGVGDSDRGVVTGVNSNQVVADKSNQKEKKKNNHKTQNAFALLAIDTDSDDSDDEEHN